MPFTYIALIMMAYFGPNATNLASIQLEVWHFEKSIEDIYLYVLKVVPLLAVDVFTFAVNTVVLAYFSEINLFKGDENDPERVLDRIRHCRRGIFDGGKFYFSF